MVEKPSVDKAAYVLTHAKAVWTWPIQHMLECNCFVLAKVLEGVAHIVLVPQSHNNNQDSTVLGIVQTEQNDRPCLKELSI